MFDISGWEFLTLAVIAVIIFGPDKLPKAAADAGKFVKQVRHYINGAKADLNRELGTDFGDVKISDFTPRGALRKAFGDEDPFDDIRKEMDGFKDMPALKESMDLRAPLSANRPVPALRAGEVPPFDPDAT